MAAASGGLADDAIATAELEVMYQGELNASSEAFNDAHDLLWWAPTDRGYYAVYVALSPADPSLGTRLVAWDVGANAVTTLLENLNTVLPDQSNGAPGQRLRAITTEDERTRDRSFLFGTAPAQPSAEAAGHLLRYHPRSREYEHLAVLDAGWSVARITRHGVEPVVLLARHADGQRHRLYRIVEDKLEPLNIEAGPELANYYHSYNGLLYYQDGSGQLMVRNPKDDEAAQPVTAKADVSLEGLTRYTAAGAHALAGQEYSVAPRYYMQSKMQWVAEEDGQRILGLGWTRGRFPYFQIAYDKAPAFDGQASALAQQVSIEAMARFVRYGENGEALLDQTPWRDGAIHAAVTNNAGGVHLHQYLPAAERTDDLGPIRTAEGNDVQRVLAMRSDTAGNLIVLADVDGKLVAILIRCPFIDDVLLRVTQMTEALYPADTTPTVAIETVDSMHAYGNEHDRNWDPLFTASDGNVYFGSMPHHPTESSGLWRYDVQTQQLEHMGTMDEKSDNDGDDRVPHMMHAFPVELEGKLYWTGQDPFYGHRYFPMYQNERHYAGSPIISQDMQTGEWKMLGIPIAGSTIHGILPAFSRNKLYLHEHYYNPVWHSYDIATGETKKLNLPSLNKQQHIDAQGFLYYIEDGSGNVMRYDPDADEATAIGRFSLAKHLPGVTWTGDQPPQHRAVWLLETLGQEKAIGYMAGCDAVVELDTTSGEIRVIGRLDPTVTELPQRDGPAVRGMAISDTTFFAITNLSGGGQPMHSRFVTLDLTTGEAQDHGVLRDQHGRLVRESNAMSLGGDGQIYINATVFNAPGDRHYSHRFSWWSGTYYDTVLARIPVPVASEGR